MSAAGDLLENVETKQAVLTISDRIKEYLPSCGLLPHTSLPRGNKRISESRLTPITVSPVRFLKHLLLPFFCLLSSACVPAAVTNSPGAYGRVTDTQSHAPLAHASVTFPGRGPTVTTDAAGLYDLPHTTKFGIVVLLPFEFPDTAFAGLACQIPNRHGQGRNHFRTHAPRCGAPKTTIDAYCS